LILLRIRMLPEGLILKRIKCCISIRVNFRKLFIQIDDGKLLFFTNIKLIDEFVMDFH
jgi:hypothetical protein